MMRGFFHGQEQKHLPYSCWFLLLAFLLAVPAGVLCQAYFGTITGVLTDPTGAVIPGVKLILTDQEKGYTFNETSDGYGRYLYRSIPPGVYSVTAEMPGFEKTVRTGIRLDVNQNVTADLKLKISSSSQTVEVKAQAQVLDSEDATTGLVVDRKFINDLPLVDRYVMDLTFPDTRRDRGGRPVLRRLHRHQFCLQRQPQLHLRRSDGWRHHHKLRAQRRRNPGHLHSVGGGGRRVPRRAVELQRRVWIFRRLRGQHDHALRNKHLPRQRLRLHPQHHHRCQQLVQ